MKTKNISPYTIIAIISLILALILFFIIWPVIVYYPEGDICKPIYPHIALLFFLLLWGVTFITLFLPVKVIRLCAFGWGEKNKRDFVPEDFISIWKWINIVSIISILIIFLWSLLKGEFILKDSIINFPIWFIILDTLFILFLSILIVYGISKKKKVGYYSSCVLVIYWILSTGTNLFDVTSTYEIIITLIGVLAYVGLGYVIYKCREYFYKR